MEELMRSGPAVTSPRLETQVEQRQAGTSPKRPWQRYAVPILLTAIALGLKLIVDSDPRNTPYLLLFAPVVASAWYGGAGPAIVAALLVVVGVEYLIFSTFPGSSLQHARVLLYLLETGLLIGLTLRMDRTQRRAEAHANALEAEQRAVARGEERFRLLVEGVSDYAIFMLDPEGRITSWNPGAERIKGYAAREAIGKHVSIFYTEADRRSGAPERALEQARTQGRYEAEVCRVRKDGTHFWANVVLTALRDEHGALRGFAKITRDITERMLAQQALEASEAQFRATFEQAAVGIAHVGLDGRWLRLNRRFCELLGYPEAELRELSFQAVTHPADLEADLEFVRQLVAGHIPGYSMEKRYLCRNGSQVWVNLTVSLVRDPSGAARYFIAVVEDISARKLAEQALRQLAHELERRVMERTEELANVNRELEAFAWSVSHDLRAPLRALDGFSKALQRHYQSQLGDQGRHYLERIQAGAKRMGELIDDLLKLSRITRTTLAAEEVDISHLAHKVLDELRKREPARHVVAHIHPGMSARGDARFLEIALQNLLSNAWKFTAKTPDARIEAGCFVQEDTTVYFVRDNGAGFDMAYRDKLFTPFQRLHKPADFEGSGIGLAIVQRVVARHGGRVWADAEVGRGATFYFTLGEPNG